jgi:hypothetical protein
MKNNESAAALISKLDKVTIPAARNAIIMEHLGESKGFKVESAEEKSAKNDKRAEVLSGLYRILADEKTGPSLSNQVLSIATVVQGYCSKEALDKDGVREAIGSVEKKLQSEIAKKDITPETASFVKKVFELVGNAHKKIGTKEPLKTQSAPSPEPVNRTYQTFEPSQTYGSTSQALRNSAPESTQTYGHIPGPRLGNTRSNSDTTPPTQPSSRPPTVGTYQATPQYQTLPVAPKGTESTTGLKETPPKLPPKQSTHLGTLQAKRNSTKIEGLGK